MQASGNKHPNYSELNLIAYGLAQFDKKLVRAFGCKTNTEFYDYIVSTGIATSRNAVSSRRDEFVRYFPDNPIKGFRKHGDTYLPIKKYIDSLYGDLDVSEFAVIVSMHIDAGMPKNTAISPIIKSRFRQLQITGKGAEIFFKDNYTQIDKFANGKLEDARLLGDGYDFQIADNGGYYLAEVKGVKLSKGSIRLTEREYNVACEYKDSYGLVIVSNLEETPKMTAIFDPVSQIDLTKKTATTTQVAYHSESLVW